MYGACKRLLHMPDVTTLGLAVLAPAAAADAAVPLWVSFLPAAAGVAAAFVASLCVHAWLQRHMLPAAAL